METGSAKSELLFLTNFSLANVKISECYQNELSLYGMDEKLARALTFDYVSVKYQAQHIFDNIWLGPIEVAESKEELERLNISQVLSVLGSN